MGPQRQRLESWGLKPKDASRFQKLEETRNRFFPGALTGSAVLLTP